MHRLAYASRAAHRFSESEQRQLAERAASRNLSLKITGYLTLTADAFFQYLEGPEPAVRALLERIRADPRHEIVTVVELGFAEVRNFPEWDMRNLRASELAAIGVERAHIDIVAEMLAPSVSLDALAGNVLSIVSEVHASKAFLSYLAGQP